MALYFSPIILAITEGIKKIFPNQVSGIVTMTVATLIGLLIGFIFPQVGIGVGLFAALIAISGATLADRVGKAMKSEVIINSDVTKVQTNEPIQDVVYPVDSMLPSDTGITRNRIEDLPDYPQTQEVSYAPIVQPYTESKELG